MTLMIASHQRAGSSNLSRFIRHAAGIDLLLEPFNRKRLGKSLPDWRENPAGVVGHIDETLSHIDGFKHIYGQHHLKFDLRLYEHQQVHRIILLQRRNFMAAALSAVIARRKGDFLAGANPDIGRIEATEIIETANKVREKAAKAVQAIKTANKPFLMVSYEEVFCEDPVEQESQLQEILRFSGLSAPHFKEAFDLYMDPNRKINKDENYENIANWREIESLVTSSINAPIAIHN